MDCDSPIPTFRVFSARRVFHGIVINRKVREQRFNDDQFRPRSKKTNLSYNIAEPLVSINEFSLHLFPFHTHDNVPP